MNAPPKTHHRLKLLPKTFYSRSPEIVARTLLGKLLIRDLHGERLTGRIIEVEAYLGLTDPASHAYRGLTPNNFPLFGPPGRTHVYFIYGMYYCLNASAHLPGEAGGVLIRAIAPIVGIETMAHLRRLSPTAKPKLLTGGPGRLCQALDITRKNSNDLDLTSPRLPHPDRRRRPRTPPTSKPPHASASPKPPTAPSASSSTKRDARASALPKAE